VIECVYNQIKMIQLLVLSLTTLVISYVATIPPGPLSVFAVHTTLQKGFKLAFLIAIGGVICESIYALLAVEGIVFFDKYPTVAFWFQAVVTILLYGIGLFTFFKKEEEINEEKISVTNWVSSILKGFSLSLFNPALIAFWILILINYKSYSYLTISSLSQKIFFVLGAGTGTFLLVLTYIFIANKKRNLIYKYLTNRMLNKIVGGIFIGLGIWQTINLLMGNP
jgi:threonine/homoserine/homoserine lactone efflux protein